MIGSFTALCRLLFCSLFLTAASLAFPLQLQGSQIFSDYSQMCVAVPPATSAHNGSTVVLLSCDGSSYQQWQFEPVMDVFRLRTLGSGMCLTIQSGSFSAGAAAVQQTCQDLPYQLWHVTGTDSNRQIRPVHTSMCLTFITNNTLSDGANLKQMLCSDYLGEKWRIDATPVITPKLPSLWEGPYQLPMAPASASILPNGKLLLWSAYARMDYNGKGQTYITVFDPIKLTSSLALIKNTRHDMFCPGTAQLGDGRIMITGGSDSNATTFFDPATNVWSIGPKMLIPRGYHAMTVLPDGSVFTMGGSWSGGYGNKNGEVWNVTTGAWQLKTNLLCDTTFLTNDAQGIYRSDNHMWFHQAPNGMIFHSGPSRRMHWINVTGNGSIQPSILRGDDLDAMNGNAVMYDIGKILTMGGATSYQSSAASARAYVIDINGAEATVQRVGDMVYQRAFANGVVLPSGEVVVVGGTAWAMIFSDLGTIRAAEIWSPVAKTFSLLAEMVVPRNYHSVAILLQDGRVLAAGGGLCGNCTVNHADAEILTPPYLLNANGSLATRPVITSAPDFITPGATISVTMDSIASFSFALVRTSVTTHTVNNDQRRIPLQLIQTSNNGTFTLSIPANSNVVLPGYYFLFAMDPNGVPSIARILRHLSASPPLTTRPTSIPTRRPTLRPSSLSPTKNPSLLPTVAPSPSPTKSPTVTPTRLPTTNPTRAPSLLPSTSPTMIPSGNPTFVPSHSPSSSPTRKPSLLPTVAPSPSPTTSPTVIPTRLPTTQPTLAPSFSPSTSPTMIPSGNPTLIPSNLPPQKPSALPTAAPAVRLTKRRSQSPMFVLRAVTNFTLINNANTSETLMPLTDGTNISLAALTNIRLNIRAEIVGPIQSVRFEFAGKNITRNRPAPYLLMSPTWVPKLGSYVLKATPFQLMKGNGAVGVSFSIQFGVTP